MRVTKKQRQVLNLVIKGVTNDQGVRVDWLDLTQLAEALPYQPTRAALKFTVRYLIEKGLLERSDGHFLRRGKWVKLLMPTDKAYALTQTERTGKRIIHRVDEENDVIFEGEDWSFV